MHIFISGNFNTHFLEKVNIKEAQAPKTNGKAVQ